MASDPILIAAPGRSGTTMLAWLLHLHGVWIGEARVNSHVGENPQVGTENDVIKKYLNKEEHEHNPAKLRNYVLSIAPKKARWLVKTPAVLKDWKLWNCAFPKALWLVPDRPAEDILDSLKRIERLKGKDLNARVYPYKEKQVEVIDNCEHVFHFHPKDLIEHNIHMASKLMEFCGLELNERVFRNWVKRDLWHG